MTIPQIKNEPDNIYKSKLHKQSMNGFIMIFVLASVGLGSYATAQDSLPSPRPLGAQAQSLSKQDIMQTADIKPLEVRNESIVVAETASILTDRASKLNDWIISKKPNSPLNNANFNTGKILLEIESETNVKAEFILAKAYQETQLGTLGVCKRNVGSVGETDNDRKFGKFCQDFRSENQMKKQDRMEHYQTDDYLYKSLRAIADTMNNQYLGNATVLCQLSNGYKGCNNDQIKAMRGKWYASNTQHSEKLASILTEMTSQEWNLQSSFRSN